MFLKSSFMRVFISTMLVALFSLFTLSSAGAETLNFRVFNYSTKMEVIPIGFVKAPAIGVMEKRGLANFENGEVAIFLARGAIKATPQSTLVSGFTQLTFNDGATLVYDWEINVVKSEETQLNISKGSGKIIEGTGRFAGIQGEITINGQGITPLNDETKGDAYFDVTANYSLPSK
jgi:hypothetical protein